MTKEQEKNNIYYVYTHIDPTTNNVMYVGHGCRGRAWYFSPTTRSSEHYEYLNDLNISGYIPSDYVQILVKNLTKEAALQIEQRYITEFDPKYNKYFGIHCLKVTEEIYQKAINLRELGLTYATIAEQLNLSSMTIYRLLNGQTKNAKY